MSHNVSVDMELAELIRFVDVSTLGRRLRAARSAAGLTQAEVAGDDVSAAYVSRIEAGQRRPEAMLLERMAARLGVDLQALLQDPNDQRHDEQRLQLDHAELSLVSGDHATALARVDELLSASGAEVLGSK